MKIDIEFNSGAQLPMDAVPISACGETWIDCAWGGEANNKDPQSCWRHRCGHDPRKVGSAVYPMPENAAALALQAGT
jgi:hypothetical protein